ncbi:MAG TPA: phosphotransferase [Armatimonadota bacterium]|nr:phosphotransferase [Armatimonadota bacterium]
MAHESLFLKLYSPGFDDYSRLGPVDTARKHALALDELPRFGVPAPRCLGFAAEHDEAALVTEWLIASPFAPAHRVEAARVLARLQALRLPDLSPELAALISRSTPNRGRIGEAPDEPQLTETTLQHGDYYSVNLVAGRDTVSVLDWDLLAVGDPMWDLGLLLCADRSVTEEEAAAVIAAYEEIHPAATERLLWHRRCWQSFWDERDRRGRRSREA